MKISIKITKDGVGTLHKVLLPLESIHAESREQRVQVSILTEVIKKIYQIRGNIEGNKPKKFNLKFYQASSLEHWLRAVLRDFGLNPEDYRQIHKIANELHQQLT